jgi:hypothetical protein
LSSTHVSPLTQGSVSVHFVSAGSWQTPGKTHVPPPLQSFEVTQATWHRPKAQTRLP